MAEKEEPIKTKKRTNSPPKSAPKKEETKPKDEPAAEAAKKGAPEKAKGGNGMSKKKILLAAICPLLAIAAAYAYKKGGKQELMRVIRETLISLQSLREYGPLGWVVFVWVFVAQLTICLPGTMVVDGALGNIYGAVLGTVASVLAKTISALISLFLGRSFGKAMGLEFPEMLKSRMGAVRTHPMKALFLARMAPISTGVKNYALALLPPEDVPLGPYVAAVLVANLLVTTPVCTLGAGADNLVDALDKATGGH
mmetsp:Transcript_85877/g.152100  ORF Transcript_85877/g.152100 Transcript_85877/m.152100 type:complete len:254 (-) Transcript_85877:71-832(-)